MSGTRIIWMSALCAVSIILLHTILPSWVNGFPESLNWDLSRVYHNDNNILDARLANHEFNRRPVVMGIHAMLNRVLPDQASFNVIQLFLLFLFFMVLGFAFRTPWVQSGAALSFPIVFAYLGSIHTYEDVLQYILILIALYLMLHKRFFLCWVVVLLGCVIRETTIVLLPLVGAYQYIQGEAQRRKAILSTAFACIVALVLLYILSNKASIDFTLNTRFTGWKRNFADYTSISESVIIPVLVIGWAFAILRTHRHEICAKHRGIYQVMIVFIVINIILVWVAAKSREARLYTMPLLTILSLIAPYLESDVSNVWRQMVRKKRRSLIAFAIACVLAFVVYRPSTGGTGLVFQAYAVVYFTFLGLYLYDPANSTKETVSLKRKM